MTKLKPKCVNIKEPALTAEGFFLPCCWCDSRNTYFKEKGFLDESLNISNVNYIVDEVFNSKIWVDFFNDIQYNNDYPSVCEEYCGIDNNSNYRITKDKI